MNRKKPNLPLLVAARLRSVRRRPPVVRSGAPGAAALRLTYGPPANDERDAPGARARAVYDAFNQIHDMLLNLARLLSPPSGGPRRSPRAVAELQIRIDRAVGEILATAQRSCLDVVNPPSKAAGGNGEAAAGDAQHPVHWAGVADAIVSLSSGGAFAADRSSCDRARRVVEQAIIHVSTLLKQAAAQVRASNRASSAANAIARENAGAAARTLADGDFASRVGELTPADALLAMQSLHTDRPEPPSRGE